MRTYVRTYVYTYTTAAAAAASARRRTERATMVGMATLRASELRAKAREGEKVSLGSGTLFP